MTAPVLQVEKLIKHFPVVRGVLRHTVGQIKAVDGVSFDLRAGETLCLVGESGCGKSTVGSTLVKLMQPTAGRIVLAGVDVTHLDDTAMRPHRRRIQMVFQDPYASLNPRLTAGEIVGEPLENYEALAGAAKDEKVAALLEKVGLRA